MGGGGTLQFSMIPMNFLMPGKVGAYADTGNFAHKAMLEADKIGETAVPIQAAAPVMIGCPKGRDPDASSGGIPLYQFQQHGLWNRIS